MLQLKRKSNLSLQEYLFDYHELVIHGTGLSTREIEDLVLAHVVDQLDANDIPVEYGLEEYEKLEWLLENNNEAVYINAIKVVGSRVKGTHSKHSDLDVVIEYEGAIREDVFFNIVNEERLELTNTTADDIPVDINPIKAEKTGTLDFWLEKNFAIDWAYS